MNDLHYEFCICLVKTGGPMKIPLYHIDAFTSRQFAGNPAAVCPLDSWLDENLLQSIAAENNLSETAYIVPQRDTYAIRWFTPTQEVDLCGHATLASGYVVFNYLRPQIHAVCFESPSGPLFVRREADLLSLDFPARPPLVCSLPEAIPKSLGREPRDILAARDYLAVFDTEEEVRSLRPDFEALKHLDRLGLIVTSAGRECDFVSRFFAPGAGISEDPVTGSSHCTLVPYWAQRLGKSRLHALQVSARGGELFCEDLGSRVKISGRAIKYMEGVIHI
jgi:predicted PhzF superfamily epimerase YddE/YHI9